MLRWIKSGMFFALLVALLAPVASGSGPPNLPPQASANRPVGGHPGNAPDGFCNARVSTDASGTPLVTSGPVGYGPAQFQTAYGLPSGSAGSGQTIGIVDAYDDPTAQQDLAKYSTTFALPQLATCPSANPCFKKVNQTGGTSLPKSNSGWALEISLDVQIAHAACPNCNIL